MLYSEIECWNKSQTAQSTFPSLFLRELCAKLVDQELAVSLHFGEIWKVYEPSEQGGVFGSVVYSCGHRRDWFTWVLFAHGIQEISRKNLL